MKATEGGKGRRMPRREFLVKLSTTAVGLGLTLGEGPRVVLAGEVTGRRKSPAVIKAAFLRPRGTYWMGWPGASYDVEGQRQRYTQQIQAAAKESGVRLLLSQQPLYEENAVKQFVAEAQQQSPDGLLLVLLHMNQWRAVNSIVEAGLPTIIFAPIGVSFTGHVAGLSRRTGVYLVSSLDFNAVKYGMRMIKAARQMRESRIVNLRGNETKETVVNKLGTQVRTIPRHRFVEEFNRVAETAEVWAIADYYRGKAQKVVEPREADILNAAKTYIASKRILEMEKADAITMDCLGLVGARQIPTPPCLAWSKLRDEGIAAGCESDLNATLTLMLLQYLFDRPGFQQDPVAETVRNLFIGAHCTSPTKLNGTDQPPEPFILRSHSESNIGVSMQVLWREGQKITIAQFAGPQRMLIYSGTVVGNVNTPPAGGCRTSVEVALDNVADVRDVEGFHQVLIYGNYVHQLRAFCQLFGIEAVPA